MEPNPDVQGVLSQTSFGMASVVYPSPDCRTYNAPVDLARLRQAALRTGKSTLLQILAGQYMVGPEAVRILGRPAFHDIQLTSSGQLSYLGQQWRRDIAFAGYNVPIQVCLRPWQSSECHAWTTCCVLELWRDV